MEPVQEQLDAYSARDLERFLACYHPDAVVEDSAGARLVDGAAALRATNEALFVIDEERVTGLKLPGLPPEMHAAVVERVRDGPIAHVRVLARRCLSRRRLTNDCS
jgi:hypothetical protein